MDTEEGTTKQERLYRRYRSLIETGILRTGERLPSVRKLSEHSGDSLNTVLGAYARLCDEGFIRSVERGGYYVHPRRRFPPSRLPGPYEIRAEESNERLDRVFERLSSVDRSFAIASPGLDLLPSDRLRRAVSSIPHEWIGYSDVAGDGDLRRRISLAYEPWMGPMKPQNILITAGATEALSIVFRALLRPGDAVAIESPTYFNYFRQLGGLGVDLLEVPVAHGGLDLDTLEEALSKRKPKVLIVQPNVQNPTGTSMSEAAKLRLLAMATETNTIIIEDDVYGDLHFGSNRPKALAGYSSYGGLITLSSFSKSVAPGLRLGWVHAPQFVEKLLDEKLKSSMDTCALSQGAISEFLGSTAHRKHLATLRRALERRIYDHQALLEDALPKGCGCEKPSGGCLLWIAFPEGLDATELFMKAAAQGLVATPGELFSANPHFKSYLRVNAGWALTPERAEGIRRLAQIASTIV